jgi:hypothetical protein
MFVGIIVTMMLVGQILMYLITSEDFDKRMYLKFYFGVFYYPIKKWFLYYHTGIFLPFYGLEESHNSYEQEEADRKLKEALKLKDIKENRA